MHGRLDPMFVISILQTLVLRNGTVTSGINSNTRSLVDAPAEKGYFLTHTSLAIARNIGSMPKVATAHGVHKHLQKHDVATWLYYSQGTVTLMVKQI